MTNNKLNLKSNLSNYDDVYQILIDMHLDFTDEESQTANAKLILALVNHIGDSIVLQQAVNIVRDNTIAWRNQIINKKNSHLMPRKSE